MDKNKQATLNNKGFTIVELMIATSVFSVVLLLCTFGLVRIGQTYYKGVTTSRAQTAARSIADNIVRSIQYGGEVTGNLSGSASGFICVGKARYTYTAPSAPDYNNSSLKLDEPPVCNGSTPTSYRELLPGGLRLSSLKIRPVPSTPPTAADPFEVTVKITAGDKDLFSGDDPVAGSCKGGVGIQFCAVSNINTQASPRL